MQSNKKYLMCGFEIIDDTCTGCENISSLRVPVAGEFR